jgi:hypothetical protein
VRKIRAIYKKSPPPAPVLIADETPRIFRSVDRTGIVHFSNIGPAN